MKPTDISQELGGELLRLYGSQAAVPKLLWETLWLLHMRLVEAEKDVAYFRERLAEYTGANPPPAEASIAGPETGEF